MRARRRHGSCHKQRDEPGDADQRGRVLDLLGRDPGRGEQDGPRGELGREQPTLTGANAYTGATTVVAGTLEAGAAGAFSATSATTVDAGATLDLGGHNETVSALSGGGAVANSGSGAATLTNQGASSIFSGVIQDGTSTTALTENAAGATLTLAGANTYTGATTVQAGALKGGAQGAFSAASATTVGSGATLDLGGYNEAVSALSGGGTVTNSGASAATLINQGASSTFSGVIQDGDAHERPEPRT